MKITVLSVMQPWAQLIIEGKKTIELRKWNTKFRGEFYIHASMKTNLEKCNELNINPKILINGAIIGKAELAGIKKYNSKKELINDKEKHFAPDYETPCYGFILENAKKIKPIKCKGSLGLWKKDI